MGDRKPEERIKVKIERNNFYQEVDLTRQEFDIILSDMPEEILVDMLVDQMCSDTDFLLAMYRKVNMLYEQLPPNKRL